MVERIKGFIEAKLWIKNYLERDRSKDKKEESLSQVFESICPECGNIAKKLYRKNIGESAVCCDNCYRLFEDVEDKPHYIEIFDKELIQKVLDKLM